MLEPVETPDVELDTALSAEASTEVVQYRNATPVVVVIVPVIGQDPVDGEVKEGVLAIRRDIEPQRGELALPGGYLEYEDWKDAGLRELREEAGVDLEGQSDLKIQSVESTDEGRKLLLFGVSDPVMEADLPVFEPNEETSERIVVYEQTNLAFPLHTKALKEFFERRA